MKNRIAIILLSVVTLACDVTIPRKEDAPELITKVQLTFTPTNGGNPITINAIDPDGEGIKSIQPDGIVYLAANTSYDLMIRLTNELVGPGNEAYDISKEVEQEGEEHLFFFAWTPFLFSSPNGDGNIDQRSDPVNYLDTDASSLPLGLATAWTTDTALTGTFRIVLKHQPGFKSLTSSSSEGETDLDVTFEVEVQ